jgi:hypothetical protein
VLRLAWRVLRQRGMAHVDVEVLALVVAPWQERRAAVLEPAVSRCATALSATLVLRGSARGEGAGLARLQGNRGCVASAYVFLNQPLDLVTPSPLKPPTRTPEAKGTPGFACKLSLGSTNVLSQEAKRRVRNLLKGKCPTAWLARDISPHVAA